MSGAPGAAAELRSRPWLLCRAGPRLCALPLGDLIEITRMLPVEPLAGAPPFVLGLTLLRGRPTPVVDAGALLGDAAIAPRRLVAVRAGVRTVALAFADVIGLCAIQAAAEAAPPLLGEAAMEAVTAIAALDAEFLHVLDTARLVSDAVLASLDALEAAR